MATPKCGDPEHKHSSDTQAAPPPEVPAPESPPESPCPPAHSEHTKPSSERAGKYGIVEVWRSGNLRTKLASASIDRGIWLWSELLERLAKLDIRLVLESSSVTDGTETVSLELKEMTSRFDPGNAPEIRTWSGLEDVQEWAPTGVLMFRSELISLAPSPHQWQESQTNRLEDKLDDIAAGLKVLLEKKHVAAVLTLERERKWEEDRRNDEQKAHLQRIEQNRRHELVKQSEAFGKAAQIRVLVQALVASSGEVDVSKFVKWANAVADDMDPVTEIIGDLRKGLDPVRPYNRY